jgi:hypothetical protein
MGDSPRIASIHILDVDCLLHVFYLYRAFLLGEDEDQNGRGGVGNGSADGDGKHGQAYTT